MEKHFNLVRQLQAQLAERGDVTALIQPHPERMERDVKLSYRALDELTQTHAHFFAAQGLGHHDQVLMLLPPGPAFYAMFLGLMRIGATAVLVDPGVGIAHLRACLKMLRPTALIGVPKAQCLRFLPELRHLRKNRAFCPGFFPGATRIAPQGMQPQVCPVAADHPALITFTSGSTGRPKAIVRSHAFLLRQGEALAALMPAAAQDVELCTFPVFTLANLAQGITTLLPPSGARKLAQIDPALLLDRIGRYRVNKILAAPDFCMKLAGQVPPGALLDSIEQIHTGGGPVYLNLVEQLKQVAPHAQIVALYGSTEAEPIALQNLTHLSGQDKQAAAQGKGLLAGPPVAVVSLRIISDQTGAPIAPLTQRQFDEMAQPAGQTGEIVVTGPLVQKSYMNPADNRETKFEVDGTVWHRTGDAGYLDAAGRLWLLGRCSAKISIQNTLVYPFALEAAATLHPQIRRAAFIQLEGRNILALEGEAPPAEIQTGLLQDFPCLDKIVLVRKIPVDKRHSSKVLYAELKTMLLNH